MAFIVGIVIQQQREETSTMSGSNEVRILYWLLCSSTEVHNVGFSFTFYARNDKEAAEIAAGILEERTNLRFVELKLWPYEILRLGHRELPRTIPDTTAG